LWDECGGHWSLENCMLPNSHSSIVSRLIQLIYAFEKCGIVALSHP
jgi:hypothetical protein